MNNKTLTLTLVVLSALGFAQVQAADTAVEIAAGALENAFSSWGKPSVEGDWKIVEENDGVFIELAESFRAKQGPDVKVFLSPTPAGQVTGNNAVTGSLFVQQLSEFSGSVRIALPAGVDLSRFQSLVFHCEAYSKLWGTSPLR